MLVVSLVKSQGRHFKHETTRDFLFLRYLLIAISVASLFTILLKQYCEIARFVLLFLINFIVTVASSCR